MALRVLERHIGHAERLLRHRECGDFALRQRRNTAGNIHRRLAGRIGRIASQTANPVYPRQHGHSAAQRHDGAGGHLAAAELESGLGR